MTPAPAAAPATATPTAGATAIDNGGGVLDIPGASTPGSLTGGDAAPFSAALAILQDPLLVGTGSDKPAAKQDNGEQIQLPAAQVDPSAAALAAVLQWLQQSTAHLLQPAHEQATTLVAAGEGTGIGAVAAGNATAAPALTALLAAQFKGNTKNSDGAAINNAAAQGNAPGANDTGASAAATGAVAKSITALATSDSKPLPQELLALANALGQPIADNASAGLQGGRASDAGAGVLTAMDALTAPAADAAGNTAATAAAGLERGAAARAAPTSAAAPVERTVSVPVHDRHWAQSIAAQVLVLANHRIESATLRLTPEHLGPVEVHIDIQDSQVNVNFGAAHTDTRSALEQALPRLREVLAGSGLTLGESSVQQQLRRGSQNRPDGARSGGSSADTEPLALSASMRAIGMIDEYA